MFDGDGDGHMWEHGHRYFHGQPPTGFDPGPGMFLSTLTNLLWLALFIWLAWVLLKWLMPYIRPMLADLFGIAPSDLPALEILRQRYAAGEIDAVTFEQMRERLEASYPHGEPHSEPQPPPD